MAVILKPSRRGLRLTLSRGGAQFIRGLKHVLTPCANGTSSKYGTIVFATQTESAFSDGADCADYNTKSNIYDIPSEKHNRLLKCEENILCKSFPNVPLPRTR